MTIQALENDIHNSMSDTTFGIGTQLFDPKVHPQFVATYKQELNKNLVEWYRNFKEQYQEVPSRELLESLLTRWAMEIARFNGETLSGGPFAAFVTDFDTADGIPVIVGFGTNHVMPHNDPSKHGEVSALQDAGETLGTADISGKVMITSCKTCPQCRAATIGANINTIIEGSLENDAEYGGFADKAQHESMEAGIDMQATAIKNIMPHQLEWLKNSYPQVMHSYFHGSDARYDAVIVDAEGKVVAYGESRIGKPGNTDPTATGITMAIRNACEIRDSVDLSDCTVISKTKPSHQSVVTADWAGIGREKSGAVFTAGEKLIRNPQKIIYLSDELEPAGASAKPEDVARLYEKLERHFTGTPMQELGITIKHPPFAPDIMLQTFKRWLEVLEQGAKHY